MDVLTYTTFKLLIFANILLGRNVMESLLEEKIYTGCFNLYGKCRGGS